MTALKTDDRLLDAMRSAARHQPTAEELEKQRVSFIIGSLKSDSSVTRSRINEVLAAQRGRKVSR